MASFLAQDSVKVKGRAGPQVREVQGKHPKMTYYVHIRGYTTNTLSVDMGPCPRVRYNKLWLMPGSVQLLYPLSLKRSQFDLHLQKPQGGSRLLFKEDPIH